MSQVKIQRPDHPSLYQRAAYGQNLEFLFSKCSDCGHLCFPHNVPGCISCGAPIDQAERVARPGLGKLRESVTIYKPLTTEMNCPVTLGHIEIADGVLVECVIEAPLGTHLEPGFVMKAIAKETADGEKYGCVFILAETAQ